jgi:hypothetical protein
MIRWLFIRQIEKYRSIETALAIRGGYGKSPTNPVIPEDTIIQQGKLWGWLTKKALLWQKREQQFAVNRRNDKGEKAGPE